MVSKPAARSGDVYDVLARLLLGSPTTWTGELRRAIASSRARAEGLAATVGEASGLGQAATTTFVAELLAGLWLDRRWTRDEVEEIVGGVAESTGLEPEPVRFQLFVRTITSRQLYELPPRLAAETHLAILSSFVPSADVSLWLGRSESPIRTLALGAPSGSRRERAAARSAIERGTVVSGERSLVHAVPIPGVGDQPAGALVVRTRLEWRARALAYATETAQVLATLLEIESLLDRNAERERSLVESSERRLVRVGFDLHDGPMQDIAALAQDVRLFRAQLASLVGDHERGTLAVGRVDDLEARLVALDRDLREIAGSLQSPTALRLPLSDAVERELAWFRRETRIEPDVETSGDFSDLTSSQKIALLRVVHEALTNVRDHSGASEVRVRIHARRAGVSAEVEDDGAGFDVESRLVDAARDGRLGLVGMGERIRLLGGRFEIESTPGSGTLVRATVPRWRPLAAGQS